MFADTAAGFDGRGYRCWRFGPNGDPVFAGTLWHTDHRDGKKREELEDG
jgi:hypothetical protein